MTFRAFLRECLIVSLGSSLAVVSETTFNVRAAPNTVQQRSHLPCPTVCQSITTKDILINGSEFSHFVGCSKSRLYMLQPQFTLQIHSRKGVDLRWCTSPIKIISSRPNCLHGEGYVGEHLLRCDSVPTLHSKRLSVLCSGTLHIS